VREAVARARDAGPAHVDDRSPQLGHLTAAARLAAEQDLVPVIGRKVLNGSDPQAARFDRLADARSSSSRQ
jgi:hypothetical protein